jgi:hypothetical protein
MEWDKLVGGVCFDVARSVRSMDQINLFSSGTGGAISLLSRTGDGSLSSAGLPPFKDGGVVYREVFGLCGTASATSLKSINKILWRP